MKFLTLKRTPSAKDIERPSANTGRWTSGNKRQEAATLDVR
jgi:hypothetical protein